MKVVCRLASWQPLHRLPGARYEQAEDGRGTGSRLQAAAVELRDIPAKSPGFAHERAALQNATMPIAHHRKLS